MADNRVKTARKTGWKVFFWFYAVLTIGVMIVTAFDPEARWYEKLLQFPVYSLVLAGLFGFAYNRRIFTARTWFFIIPLSILWDIYDWVSTDWTSIDLTNNDPSEIGLMFLSLAIFSLPLYVLPYLALYKYSFRSPEIWVHPETRPDQPHEKAH